MLGTLEGYIPPGDLDGCETKGLAAGKGIRKSMKTKGRQNRRVAKTHGVAGERGSETGTRPAEPYTKITASVTVCQVKNKRSEMDGLRARLGKRTTMKLDSTEENRERLVLHIHCDLNRRQVMVVSSSSAFFLHLQ